MTRLYMTLVAVALTLSAGALEDIRTDPNLERRAHDALTLADSAFDQAKTAYAAGDVEKAGADS